MPTPRGADRLLTLAALVLLGLFAIRAGFLLASPYPEDYGEGTTWVYARLLQDRGSYFLPIDREPYIHGTYPPLFPFLHATFGGSLAAGRGLALGAMLAAAAAIASILAAHGIQRRRAWLWAAVFLGVPVVHEWAALCRVDSLALGLSLAGLAWLARRDDSRGDLVAAAIFAAAFFAKQVALAAPVATFASLLLRGERRRAGIFVATWAGLVGGIFFLLDRQSGGEMHRHLITYTGVVGLAPGPVVRWVLRFAFTLPVLLPLAFAAGRAFFRTPAGVWLPLAVATLVATGKPGSGVNYLLEPSAAVVLGGALVAERRLAALDRGSGERRDRVLLLLVQLVILCGPGRLVEWRDLGGYRAVSAAAVATLASARGPVLCEDLGLTLAAGKEAMFEPFQFGLLARAGRFDPRGIVAQVEASWFDVVLLGFRLKAVPGVAEAVRANYRFEREIGPYEVWRKGSAPAPSPGRNLE